MTRVDFYLLNSALPAARLAGICRIIERAVRARQSVFVHAADRALLIALDDALWHFSPESFIAHTLLEEHGSGTPLDARDPVHLGSGEPHAHRQVLVNLADAVPPFFSRFERTIEVVDGDVAVRDAGRERFRYYRERGYPLHHHRLG